MDRSLSFLLFYAVASLDFLLASSSFSSSVCPLESEVFRCSVQSQCPRSMLPNPPLEVDGTILDRVMNSKYRMGYTAVLFYASWCPFSESMRLKFDVLSSIFPQIEHLAVEQSTALPSVFSRYGIHSLPSILIVNQTAILRYRGPKDTSSLMSFYERTTGRGPLQYMPDRATINMFHDDKSISQFWSRSSIKEIAKMEPYLAFSICFLSLRIFMFLFPWVISHLKAVWIQIIPHPNLGIFGETSQLFGRALYMIDVRRVWTRLRLSKTGGFHERARNARVWASSLASVSLGGESSSARSSS